MATYSSSVVDHTFKHIEKKLSHTIDLFGNAKKTTHKRILIPDWKLITTSSKVGDFKLQDYLRSKTPKRHKAFYNAGKMTYSEAQTKAAQAYTTMSVSHSIDSDGGFMDRTYEYARTAWTTTCAASVAQSVDPGNSYIVATSKDTSAGVWHLQRALMGFNLQKARVDAHYTKVVLKIYTGQGACTKTNVIGWTVKPVRWTGGPTVTTADFNDFNINYQSTTATNVTASGDADEYNEIVIDGTLLDWMNANPQGDINNHFYIMLRGAYDYGEDGTDGVDPTGVNQLIFASNTAENITANKHPQLYVEWTSSVVPDIGDLSDRDGAALSGTASIEISGIHTSSFRDPAVGYDANKWNHNNSASVIGKKAYQNNFLINSGETGDWQFCYSQSIAGGNKIEDKDNEELTIVGQNGGWNFKVKKGSVKHFKNVLNFKKKN